MIENEELKNTYFTQKEQASFECCGQNGHFQGLEYYEMFWLPSFNILTNTGIGMDTINHLLVPKSKLWTF